MPLCMVRVPIGRLHILWYCPELRSSDFNTYASFCLYSWSGLLESPTQLSGSTVPSGPTTVGALVGALVGAVGASVGDSVGGVGDPVGTPVGALLGGVGASVGLSVGGDGEPVGALLGPTVSSHVFGDLGAPHQPMHTYCTSH